MRAFHVNSFPLFIRGPVSLNKTDMRVGCRQVAAFQVQLSFPSGLALSPGGCSGTEERKLLISVPSIALYVVLQRSSDSPPITRLLTWPMFSRTGASVRTEAQLPLFPLPKRMGPHSPGPQPCARGHEVGNAEAGTLSGRGCFGALVTSQELSYGAGQGMAGRVCMQPHVYVSVCVCLLGIVNVC